MSFSTAATHLLSIRTPVVSAPMGGVAGGQLAAAVSAAGGMGTIGAGYADPEWIDQQFSVAGQEKVGIGFITWYLAKHPAQLEATLSHQPPLIILSFGNPGPFIDDIKESGALVACQVQTASEALHAAKLGADLIIAQGTEAGGHGSTLGTLALVPAVVDTVHPVPVLAAGGIADGRGLAAALTLGAAGALIGTRFYASQEALGYQSAKERIVSSSGEDTLRTEIFDIVRGYDWPRPFTGRCVANSFTRRWHRHQAELFRCLAEQRLHYQHAAEAGDVDTAVVWASESISLINEIESAEAILRRLSWEALNALERAHYRSNPTPQANSWQPAKL